MTESEIPSLARVTLWFNPSCSKSRRAREILEQLRVDVEPFAYLETPPTREQLEELLAILGKGPRHILRRGEAAYAEHALDGADDARVIEAMLASPILIERPIGVVHERRLAVVARPPELIVELLAPGLPAGKSANEAIRDLMQGKLPGN